MLHDVADDLDRTDPSTEASDPPGRSLSRPAIRVLPPAVAAQIAAGEVIERPASAVKELVENALDAGARRVRVDIQGGGLVLIRVSDDGHGIPTAELPLALARHATSKLADHRLTEVRTLGFRGEALPSIAAVAELRIASRAHDEAVGRRLTARFGRLIVDEPAAHPRGVTVTVRHLFEELPARLMASSRPQAELAYIGQLLRRLALAAPEVRLHLAVDGRPALSTAGSGDPVVVAGEIYGPAIAGSVRALPELALPQARIRLICCGPDVTRPGRGQVSVIVNGRWVQPRSLLAMIETAYRPLLPRGRHPLLIVLIDVPPDRVDINVHPSKQEVRLLDEAIIGAQIGEQVRGAFGQQARLFDVGAWATLDLGCDLAPAGVPGVREDADPWDEERTIVTPHLPPLRLIGQVQDRLILVEGPSGLYLIDQHRAHERVLYDRLRVAHGTGGPEPVALPEPLVLELKPHQVARFSERLSQLADLGFSCEIFGGRSYLIRAAPPLPGYVSGLPADARDQAADPNADLVTALAEPGELAPLLLALADEPAAEGEDWLERLLVALSCRNALRRGRPLTRAAMRSLVHTLGHTSAPAVCPHGSPALVHLSGAVIQRQFGWR